MAINTAITITLTAQYMRDLGFVFDSLGNITSSPAGIWSSAIWFGNNDVDTGNVPLINNGALNGATPILDASNTVTGFKFTLPAFTQNAIKGGVMYIALASDTSIDANPFAGLSEGEINNLQQAYNNNFTFGTFEFTLQGGSDDQGDLTAISTFGFPMSATSLVSGSPIDSVGFNETGNQIWSQINALGTTSSPSVYQFVSTNGPLSGNAFAITPTTAVGGSFTPPTGKSLPFSSSDWDAYLDTLALAGGTLARISGTYNGATSPVNNWVSSTNNVQTDVWHNAGFFDYEVSYQSALNLQIDGTSTTAGGFLLSPTATSQIQGYIVIPKGAESGIASDWNGGVANSIYSTLGMAQVYAQDPSQVSGQTPFLFQDATAANNGSATSTATTEFFNVGANTQWGKVFTQFLTGLAAGYIGSTGTPLNPLDSSDAVDLSQSWNWDPTYAFGQNLSSMPYGSGAAFQFTDNYAKIFFQNSNVYGDMYSDNLMSLYDTGSPLLTLSNPAGGNVDEINVMVFGASETPTGYIQPRINNYPGELGTAPTLVSPTGSAGTYTLNFLNAAGGPGQQNFVLDDNRATIAVRVWDPTLNDGAGGFSNTAELPAFPTAQVTVSGFAGQLIPKGTVLQSIISTSADEAQQVSTVDWIVQSDTTIPASGGSATNGSVTLTVTASSTDAVVSMSDTWEGLALAFPSAVTASNSAASASTGGGNLPTVIVRLSGDAGASFDKGYVVDSAGNQWSFASGVIDPVSGFTDVTATAANSGISVPAGEQWAGLYQYSPVVTQSASVPGLFWSNFAASYENGVLDFINQNNTGQAFGELELVNMPLGANQGDIVWYQIIVNDTVSSTAKSFNFYPAYGINTSGSQNIDGGASISLGDVTNTYTINFAGSGTDALPGSLFIPNQNMGAIPLQGTPFAPVLGTQDSSFYQFLGQSLDFTAVPSQVTSGSNTLPEVAGGSYVFGWTGLNPSSLTDGSLQAWSNKVNGLDIVQITVVDTADATRNQTVFAQGDLDGQWLTGTAATIDPVGTELTLVSKPVSLVAGREYQISYQEFTPNDQGLSKATPSGTAPISSVSNVLTVSTAGTSGFLDTLSNEQNNYVYGLYEGLLDRVPDADGFAYWSDEIDDPASRSDLVRNVVLSPEFQSKWGQLSDEQFIKTAYAFILDRAPDSEGQAYWLDSLQHHPGSRNQVLQSFLESPEAVQLFSALTEPGYLAVF